MDKHLSYMQRAVDLAEKARGKCSPNPFVGAVIVKNGRVIGEGWTQSYGSDHAEVQAIKNCSEPCNDADIYVTLEPCSHYGKTPPCAKAIIENGIKSVYIGIPDPNTLVSGQGIAMLSEAGIQVNTGFLADIITKQLEHYLTWITKQRPFVILKTAVSLDGRIAAEDGSSKWITCEESRKRVHELRQEADAVLTGIGTVLKDDPLLNVRLKNPHKQPLRIILDTNLSIPLQSKIALTAAEYKTLVFTGKDTSNPAKEEKLNELGVEICRIDSDGCKLDLQQLLAELYNRKIQLVMVEAGTKLNSSFLKAGLVDKLYMFIAPKLLGGSHLAWQDIGIGNIEQSLNLKGVEYTSVGTDILLTAYF
jgi:diaminohydroxyphosphoribosylaminopyrimidine deaminase / 5-amino-6-(5-phosphoribosylamino)uracil reductase